MGSAMTKQEIETVLDRVKTWPLSRQEDAARTLLWMEEKDAAPYVFTAEEERMLDEAEAEGVASETEVRAFFDRYR